MYSLNKALSNTQPDVTISSLPIMSSSTKAFLSELREQMLGIRSDDPIWDKSQKAFLAQYNLRGAYIQKFQEWPDTHSRKTGTHNAV